MIGRETLNTYRVVPTVYLDDARYNKQFRRPVHVVLHTDLYLDAQYACQGRDRALHNAPPYPQKR